MSDQQAMLLQVVGDDGDVHFAITVTQAPSLRLVSTMIDAWTNGNTTHLLDSDLVDKSWKACWARCLPAAVDTKNCTP